MILLVVQFGWVQRSMELDRQELDLRTRENSGKIRQAFLADKIFQQVFMSEPGNRKDFVATIQAGGISAAIKQKTDSVLSLLDAPISDTVHTRTGNYCYLMNFVPPDEHNPAIDNAQYKVCLCNNDFPLRLDVGFNLLESASMGLGTSALVWPSVILIFLLIAVFAYAIYVINRQKKLAELKNDFINNLTHEFNTPLFSIGITGNLLLRSEPVQQSNKLKEYVELIQKEKGRIQTQVDKILQLTALESGAVPMEKQKLDMHQLIEEAMESFAMVIAEKGGSVRFVPAAGEHLVLGDKLHLFNALANLLDNACKYSASPPEISIGTKNDGRDMLVSIADRGIGISSPDKKMIFRKFYRVKQGDRHDVKGFGLGLSYVKKIVELHGGSVEAETPDGKGAVFVIRLPYASN